jgi:hypothetical protein
MSAYLCLALKRVITAVLELWLLTLKSGEVFKWNRLSCEGIFTQGLFTKGNFTKEIFLWSAVQQIPHLMKTPRGHPILILAIV